MSTTSVSSATHSDSGSTMRIPAKRTSSAKSVPPLDVQELCNKLGHRSRRRRSSSASLLSPTRLEVQYRNTASIERKIKIVGRFATPHQSPENTPALSAYNSGDESEGSDLEFDIGFMEVDPNDADDEADARDMERRGRSRRERKVLVGRKGS